MWAGIFRTLVLFYSMQYRALDDSGDMRFGAGSGDFLVDSPEAVAQAVGTRLRLWLGEWFIDQTEGTPYQQAVLGKYTAATIAPAIRARILGTQGVTALDSLDVQIDPDARQAAVTALISTAYGPATVTEVL